MNDRCLMELLIQQKMREAVSPIADAFVKDLNGVRGGKKNHKYLQTARQQVGGEGITVGGIAAICLIIGWAYAMIGPKKKSDSGGGGMGRGRGSVGGASSSSSSASAETWSADEAEAVREKYMEILKQIDDLFGDKPLPDVISNPNLTNYINLEDKIGKKLCKSIADKSFFNAHKRYLLKKLKDFIESSQDEIYKVKLGAFVARCENVPPISDTLEFIKNMFGDQVIEKIDDQTMRNIVKELETGKRALEDLEREGVDDEAPQGLSPRPPWKHGVGGGRYRRKNKTKGKTRKRRKTKRKKTKRRNNKRRKSRR